MKFSSEQQIFTCKNVETPQCDVSTWFDFRCRGCYFANCTALVSLMTVIFICPGYVISVWI